MNNPKEDRAIGSLIRFDRPTVTRNRDNAETLASALVVKTSPSAGEYDQVESSLLPTQFFATGFRTKHLSNASAQEMVSALFEGPYSIIHITGDAVATGLFGISLDSNYVITSAEIGQLAAIPELVFLNIRSLVTPEETQSAGASSETLPKRNTKSELAARFAMELRQLGIPMVVVTGWAVDRRASHTWISSFYGKLLSGDTFGASTQHAQVNTFMNHRGLNTWGAFQCYGDPRQRINTPTMLEDE
jgi:hypothetical protein